MRRFARVLTMGVVVMALAALPSMLQAQEVQELQADPSSIQIEQGQTASFEIRALDGTGVVVDDVELRISGAGQGFDVNASARTVTGTQGGNSGAIIVSVILPDGVEGQPASLRIPVEVAHPSVVRGEIHTPERIYAHTATTLDFTAYHGDETERPDPRPSWRSSDDQIVSVNRFGQVVAHQAGQVTLTAEYEGVQTTREVQVHEFPGTRIQLTGGADEARMGDVLHFQVQVTDDQGRSYDDVPVDWGYAFRPLDEREQPGATALIDRGRFVAEEPGVYTVIASAGPLTARETVEIEERHVVQSIELQGQGRVSEVHTSDFWVFEGRDGRDYAISGTWGADGFAYMWDVTDRANLVKTDSVQVDARTVNDVKVSPDARYALMTREGASDRRNGLVILDLEDPAHPVIASTVDEGLTGGVHNAFPKDDYAYALSGGEKYVIIDVADIYNPRTVGEVQHENCRIHDVWVLDGMGYSAQWGCGILVYDVGNGQWGGTPENPVFVSQITTPGGRAHAVFPYYQESTGRFLVFAGDEILNRRGMPLEGGLSREPYNPETDEGGRPSNTAGYIHVLDFTDMQNPKKVARYKVPEYGTHNIWVEDDVLYQAYYEGGVRLVDVSGEMMGNLATQGREIAVYKPADPAGYIANAPMVWSAMPFKGEVFLSDWNSGMWALQLQPRDPLTMQQEN